MALDLRKIIKQGLKKIPVIITMFTYSLTKSPTLKALSLIMLILLMLYGVCRYEIKDYIKDYNFKRKNILVKMELKKIFKVFIK